MGHPSFFFFFFGSIFLLLSPTVQKDLKCLLPFFLPPNQWKMVEENSYFSAKGKKGKKENSEDCKVKHDREVDGCINRPI